MRSSIRWMLVITPNASHRTPRRKGLGEQLVGGRGDDGAPRVLLEHHELEVARLRDTDTGLAAHQQTAEVVPRRKPRWSAVDERVDGPCCDRAQVERRGAEHAVLVP